MQKRLYETAYEEALKMAAKLRKEHGHLINHSSYSLANQMMLRVLAGKPEFNDRDHARFYARKAVRNVFLDELKAYHAQKRIPQYLLQTLHTIELVANDDLEKLLEINQALDWLEHNQPDLAELYIQRVFLGAEITDLAKQYGVSSKTIQRRLRSAEKMLWGYSLDSRN